MKDKHNHATYTQTSFTYAPWRGRESQPPVGGLQIAENEHADIGQALFRRRRGVRLAVSGMEPWSHQLTVQASPQPCRHLLVDQRVKHINNNF